MSVDPESLTDRIYQAALFPEDWPGVLDHLGGLVDGAGGSLVTRRGEAWLGLTASPALLVLGDGYYTSGAAKQSRVSERMLALNRAGFVADHEVMGDDEWLDDPLNRVWGTPAGFHRAVGTWISLPDGDFAVLHLPRRIGKPRFTTDDLARLDPLRPHLARASMLASRWRLERLRAAVEALELLGLPAAVLDSQGRVLVANAAIGAMDSHVVWRAHGRIALHDPKAAEMLRRFLEGLFWDEKAGGCSMPAKARDESSPAIVHAIPISGKGRDIFGGGLTLLVINRVDAARPLDPVVIQGLFDLTAGEARVAAGVLDGASVDELSRRHEVSRETIRTQLKAVFAKSGVGRQAEFVAKFRQASSPRGARRPS